MLACELVISSLLGDGTVLSESILSCCWRVVRLVAHGRWRPWLRLQPSVLLSWIVLKYCQNRGDLDLDPTAHFLEPDQKVMNMVVFNGTKLS